MQRAKLAFGTTNFGSQKLALKDEFVLASQVVPATENGARKCISSHLTYRKLGKMKTSLKFKLRKESQDYCTRGLLNPRSN